jgi:hypothetical protein
MTKHKFKVGDTVIMNKESEYYNGGKIQLNDNMGTKTLLYATLLMKLNGCMKGLPIVTTIEKKT